MTAIETQMREIVSNTFCESFVVRVVGVLLLPCFVDVERITIGPRIDLASAA